MSEYKTALRDVYSAVTSYRIWNLLAIQDVRQRYRRSVLGPFWITLSSLISIGALAIVYTKIFKIPSEEYLPFLAVGIICWTFISSLIVEACGVFISAEGIIKQVNLPFGIHVGRMVWRNVIVMAHNLVVVAAILVYSNIPLTINLLLFPLALAEVAVAGIAIGYLMGGVCTRFRDIPQLVSSLIQVLFYVTPVIWKPNMLAGNEELMYLNPLYHYLEIMRQPLLGHTGNIISWIAATCVTVTLAAMAIFFLMRFRKRIAYWL